MGRAAPESKRAASRRVGAKRVALCLGAPPLFLALLELVLRLAGSGGPTGFFVTGGSNGELVPNEDFGRLYHCPETPVPFVLPPARSGDEIRIFVLGESAAAGTPDHAFAVSRCLGVLLRDRFPGRRIEVFNAAMMGINSFAVADIARACAAREADLLLVYAGNNELVGSFGVDHISARLPPVLSHAVIRASLFARGTRTGQGIGRLLPDMRAKEIQDGGFFLRHAVAADDPRRLPVYENFRRNLREICALARGGRTRIVLSTVAINLRDCPPLVSAAPSAGSAGPATANAHYLRAQQLERCGDAAAALLAYQAAVDADEMPFRSDSRINGVIRDVAGEGGPGVSLVDAERLLATPERGGAGIAGEALFYDHVHFRFRGNYELARALLPAVEAALADRLGSAGPVRELLPPGEIAARLAFTAWDELKLQAVIARLFAKPPFTLQLDQAGRLAAAQAHAERLQQAFTPDVRAQSVRVYEDALELSPDDLHLHVNFGELLDALGLHAVAAVHWRHAADRFPRHRLYRVMLERCQARAGREPPGPGQLAAWHLRAGTDEQAGGRHAVAVDEYGRALARGLDTDVLRNNLGVALLALGRTNEAARHMERAVALAPDHGGARANLGLVRAAQGLHAEAIIHLRRVVERGVPDAGVALRLAWLLATAEDDALRNGAEALRLVDSHREAPDAASPRAMEVRAAALAECGRFAEAAAAMREARRQHEARGDRLKAAEAAERIALFEANKPLRLP